MIPTQLERNPLYKSTDYYDTIRLHVNETLRAQRTTALPHTLSAIDDARQFIEMAFDDSPIKQPSLIKVDGSSVELTWIDDNHTVKIWFLGHSEWSYSLTSTVNLFDHTDPLHGNMILSYSGKCEEYTHETISSNKPTTIKMFFLPEVIVKAISDEPQWEYLYPSDQVVKVKPTTLWVTSYWDGIMSGWVKFLPTHKSHYIAMVEEQQYTRDRMYAAYDVTLWYKVKEYAIHLMWAGLSHRDLPLRKLRGAGYRWAHKIKHMLYSANKADNVCTSRPVLFYYTH